MPSSRKQLKQKPEPVVFIDRSLGFHDVAKGLREAGIEAYSIEDLYGKDAAERMDDEVWIKDAAERGMIQFTKDKKIRYVPSEKAAVKDSGARVFCLSSGDLTVEQQVQAFLKNWNRIKQRSQHRRPFIDKVYEDDVNKWWWPELDDDHAKETDGARRAFPEN